MSHPSSPAVSQLELTVRIRVRRRELGLDARTVSKHLGFSPNYWSAVENDRSILSREKLTDLVAFFKFPDSEAQELLELQSIAKRQRWWAKYDAILDDDLMQLFGLEYGSEKIMTYEGLLITGLLQSEDYASAVIGTDPAASAVSLKQRWELRKRRQRRLRGDDRLHLTTLMSESTLMQQFGGRAVLRGQLEYLAATIDELSDSLVVRILPFTATPLGMTGASTLHLLDFASPHLPMIAWRESVTPIGFTDDPDEVEILKVSYEQALDQASLSREQSLELIEQRIGELS